MQPKKLTTRYVNSQLKKTGIRLELVQGKGYLYFVVPDAIWQEWYEKSCLPSLSLKDEYKVDVCWLNHLDFSAWMQRAHWANEEIWGVALPG